MQDRYYVCTGLQSIRRSDAGYLENCSVYRGLVP